MRQILINSYAKPFTRVFILMFGLFAFSLSALAQPTPDADTDFDGDGQTDYSIVRDETSSFQETTNAQRSRRSLKELRGEPGFKPLIPAAGNNLVGSGSGSGLGWYISNSQTGTARIEAFGNPATDFYVPEDYDGDGQDDLAVWRAISATGPGGAFFHIFNSSTSTISTVDFGQLFDNPTVVGDYDGDGTADPAVYRCPPSGGQCTFFYMGSAGGGGFTSFNWGNDSFTASRPYPGDFDGDGMNDFCVFNNGVYALFRSSDGGVEFVNWGLGSDEILAPGDYDGDGSTDFMNVRLNGSSVEWWLLERDGGISAIPWGALIGGFSEFATPGDYDNDGSTDIAIWRRDNTSTSNSLFYVLRSSDGGFQTFEWGSMSDAPIPGWNAN